MYISTFSRQTFQIMHYYILRKGQEYVIYKVRKEDDQSFREKYANDVLVEADNILHLLMRFEQEIMFSLDYIPKNINFSHLKGT